MAGSESLPNSRSYAGASTRRRVSISSALGDAEEQPATPLRLKPSNLRLPPRFSTAGYRPRQPESTSSSSSSSPSNGLRSHSSSLSPFQGLGGNGAWPCDSETAKMIVFGAGLDSPMGDADSSKTCSLLPQPALNLAISSDLPFNSSPERFSSSRGEAWLDLDDAHADCQAGKSQAGNSERSSSADFLDADNEPPDEGICMALPTCQPRTRCGEVLAACKDAPRVLNTTSSADPASISSCASPCRPSSRRKNLETDGSGKCGLEATQQSQVDELSSADECDAPDSDVGDDARFVAAPMSHGAARRGIGAPVIAPHMPVSGASTHRPVSGLATPHCLVGSSFKQCAGVRSYSPCRGVCSERDGSIPRVMRKSSSTGTLISAAAWMAKASCRLRQ